MENNKGGIEANFKILQPIKFTKERGKAELNRAIGACMDHPMCQKYLIPLQDTTADDTTFLKSQKNKVALAWQVHWTDESARVEGYREVSDHFGDYSRLVLSEYQPVLHQRVQSQEVLLRAGIRNLISRTCKRWSKGSSTSKARICLKKLRIKSISGIRMTTSKN